VAEERRRIARDMHDNIGAQLLGALHSRETERKDTMIRETLSDLRDIINNASRTGLPLDETLADLRMETAERLSSAGIALEWKIDAHPTPVLAPNTAHALRSMLREAVSNVIRHSSADRLNVRIHQDGNAIRLAIEDDGHGFDQKTVHTGYGLANMTTRVAGLGGPLDIVSSETGTRLEARVPFERPGELA
jgi:signal transduction histidine kinase